MSDNAPIGVGVRVDRPKRAGRSRPYVLWLFWAAAAAALFWTLRSISLASVLAALRELTRLELFLLTGVNLLILALLSGRWWVVVRALGYPQPYGWLAIRRIAAFAVSYLTPGPQFGGEPLQVIILTRRGTPTAAAVASVALDKTLELLVNFGLLALGVAAALPLAMLTVAGASQLAGVALVVMALLVLYMAVVSRGRLPVSSLLARIPLAQGAGPAGASLPFRHWLHLAVQSEAQMGAFCRERPYDLVWALGFSVVSWAAMIGEYALMARFLELPLTLPQALATLSAARLAYLLPFPGGLGVLEASQMLAVSQLGFDPASGAALALLIRARDVAVALLGILIAARMKSDGGNLPRNEAMNKRER